MLIKKLAVIQVLCLCLVFNFVACSSDNKGQDSGTNSKNTVTDSNNTSSSGGNSDVTDSMDELKDDVKDTAEDMKDKLTGESDSSMTNDGNTNPAGNANNINKQ